jgi:hypothetical protein
MGGKSEVITSFWERGYYTQGRFYMKNVFKLFGIIALAAVIVFSMAGCDFQNDPDAGDPDGNGTGGTGNPQDNAKTVTVGYSSSHTIASSGEHWFKFIGTGDPVIFETEGNVVDTYMGIWDDYSYIGSYLLTVGFGLGNNDNSGEGNNALCSFNTTSGKTYWIKITASSGTSGTFTFVVK